MCILRPSGYWYGLTRGVVVGCSFPFLEASKQRPTRGKLRVSHTGISDLTWIARSIPSAFLQPVPPLSKSRRHHQNAAAVTMASSGKRNEQERKKLEKTDVKISEARLFNADGELCRIAFSLPRQSRKKH